MILLESNGYPKVKENDIIFTEECRACFDPGMCGESIVQQTRYRIVWHNQHLMAKCLDYKVIKELKNLYSYGAAWKQLGYTKENIFIKGNPAENSDIHYAHKHLHKLKSNCPKPLCKTENYHLFLTYNLKQVTCNTCLQINI